MLSWVTLYRLLLYGINKNEVRIRGEFKWSEGKIYEKLENKAYILVKNKEKLTLRIYFKADKSRPLDYIDEKYEVKTNESGLEELKKINLNNVFSYPKPISLIKFFLNIVADSNITILDFF